MATGGTITKTGYTYYAAITIDNTKVEADHTNFPVCVQGTFDGTGGEPDLRVAGSGGEIQNVDSSATISGSDDAPADFGFFPDANGDADDLYDFEIELYDKTTGQITAWVKIPTMDADADLTFYMCYGNDTITESQENIAAVWTNYECVWHMAQASGDMLDSVGSQTLADNGNPTYRQSGKTGYAVSLDGNDYFYKSSVYNFSGQANWLITGVYKLEDNNADQYLWCTGTNDGLYARVDDSATQAAFFKIDDGTDDDYGAGTTGMYDEQWHTWHHGVHDTSSEHQGWIDGDLDYDGVNTSVGALEDTFFVGIRDTLDSGVVGDVCELRVTPTMRADSYIKTEHNSFDPSTFLSVGSETATTNQRWTVHSFTL